MQNGDLVWVDTLKVRGTIIGIKRQNTIMGRETFYRVAIGGIGTLWYSVAQIKGGE